MLDDTLLTEYIAQEFYFRDKKHKLYETRGIVPGLEQLVNAVSDKFIDLYNNNKIDWNKSLTINQNVYRKNNLPLFFNKMLIKIKFDSKNGENLGDYELNIKNLNKDNKINILKIFLILKKDNIALMISSLKTLIAHELTHAWEDYERKRKGDISLYAHVNNIDYSRFNIDKNDGIIVKYIKNIAYELTDVEQHAYIGSIFMQLLPFKSKIQNRRKNNTLVYTDIIQNTEVYSRISELGKKIILITNTSNTQQQQKILNTWNDISKIKFKTYNGLRNKLMHMWNKYLSKFYSVASKAIYDICNESQDILHLTTPNFSKLTINELKSFLENDKNK